MRIVNSDVGCNNHAFNIPHVIKKSNGILFFHKYITDRAELVVDSPQANYAIHAVKELRYLSIVHRAGESLELSPAFFINTGKSIYMDLHEVYRNSGLGKWFHGESANKTPGWDRYNSEGEMVGECGDAKKGESYSACLSKQKAEKLGKEGRASFVKRKRAAQSEAGRGKKGSGGKGQKPINVDTGASKMDENVQLINESKNKPNDPEKWSACKSAAKQKFDVYPSAYANAWAAKCYKKKGGTWRSIKEETEMYDETEENTTPEEIKKEQEPSEPLEEIKEATKLNIIKNLKQKIKSSNGPGKASQRPKSWNKGTKSGSEKRKSREEGKREAREINEDRNWLYAAHDALQGYISPADVTTHFQNKEFSSPEHFRSALQQLTDDHADRFISTQTREGADPEKAMRSFSDRIMGKFDTRLQELQAAEARNQAQIAQGRSGRQYKRDGYDAARDERAIDWFEGRRGPGSWEDYYDQPESWRESVEYRLRSMMEEWPNRESQAANAPHELPIPDDIGDYESRETSDYDPVHAEHFQDAMDTLKGAKDIDHAKNLVMRGAIGAALGRASAGNSKDPTLRHIVSILRGRQDALDAHFKQTQSGNDIPFEESVSYKRRNVLRNS